MAELPPDLVRTPVGQWMCCAICHRVLEHRRDGAWLHPTWLRGTPEEDHAPLPVPRSEIDQVEEVCDFCFEPRPAWELPTKNFQMPPGGGLNVSTSGWACCDGCADLIRRDMWTQLSRRALAGYERTHGTMTEAQKTYLRRLYRDVRHNVVGDVHPNNPHQDKEYGVGESAPDITISGTVRWAGDGSSRAPSVPGGDRALRQR